jgi:hypothetical protein
MAPTLEVQIRDLVAMTRDLSGAANAFAGVERLVSDTHIATSNWPAAGWHAAGVYKEASSTARGAAGAVHAAGGSTAGNLDAVARHYAGAEYHSSVIPAAPPGAHRPNSGSHLTPVNGARLSIAPAEGGIAVLLTLAGARSSVKASARATGLLPIFLAVDALTIEPNIRDSGPFREARDTWRSIAGDTVRPLLGELDGLVPLRGWEGEAATNFDAHMRYRFLPALERFESLATSMGDLCDTMATGMDEINKQWLALLIKTSMSLLMLNFVPLPYRPMLSLATATLFVTNVGYLYWKLKSWFADKAVEVARLEKQAAALAADCFDDAQTLDTNRALLNPRFTMVSTDWTTEDWSRNWHYTTDV